MFTKTPLSAEVTPMFRPPEWQWVQTGDVGWRRVCAISGMRVARAERLAARSMVPRGNWRS